MDLWSTMWGILIRRQVRERDTRRLPHVDEGRDGSHSVTRQSEVVSQNDRRHREAGGSVHRVQQKAGTAVWILHSHHPRATEISAVFSHPLVTITKRHTLENSKPWKQKHTSYGRKRFLSVAFSHDLWGNFCSVLLKCNHIW